MIGLSFIELLVMAAVIYAFVAQVGLPLWRGTPLWPMFESREQRLLREREQVEQELRERELEAEIEERRAHLRKAAEATDTRDRVRGIRIAQDKGETL